MLRFQDLTDSEEEEEEENTIEHVTMEKEEEKKEEEEKRQLHQTIENDDFKTSAGDTTNTKESSEVHRRGFLSLLETLYEKDHKDHKDQAKRSTADIRSSYTENLSDSVEAFFSKAMGAKNQAPRIAFSAQEIYSQAEMRNGQHYSEQLLPKKPT